MKVSIASKVNCSNGSGTCLNPDDLSFWFRSILKDDLPTIEKHMKDLSIVRQNEILDGHVCVDIYNVKVKGIRLESFQMLMYSSLWFITVTFGAEKIIEWCIKRGVNVTETDKNNDNVIHALIHTNFARKQVDDRKLNCLRKMKSSLDPEDLTQLLKQENDFGYRPLELAAHLGCLKLFNEILKTTPTYITRIVPLGAFETHYYDITEYESIVHGESRSAKSPLWYLVNLDQSCLDDPTASSLFSDAPLKVWCDLKIKAATPFIVVWFIVRLLFAVSVVAWGYFGGLLEPTERRNIASILSGNRSLNESNCIEGIYSTMPDYMHSAYFITILQIVFSTAAVLIISYDLVEWILWVKSGKRERFTIMFSKKKSLICNGSRFRINQIWMALACLTLILGVLIDVELISNVSYTVVTFTAVWSLFYFLQLIPWIGPMIINIERLLSEIFGFSFIFLIFTIPMGYIITSLQYQSLIGPCTAKLLSTDVVSMFYGAFLIMLNIVNFESPLSEKTSLEIFHVIFVFTVSVLLLNYLIASFSYILTQQLQNQQTVSYIQRLHLALTCEHRVAAVFPGLVHWIHTQCFQYCPDTRTFYVNDIWPRNALQHSKF